MDSGWLDAARVLVACCSVSTNLKRNKVLLEAKVQKAQKPRTFRALTAHTLNLTSHTEAPYDLNTGLPSVFTVNVRSPLCRVPEDWNLAYAYA